MFLNFFNTVKLLKSFTKLLKIQCLFRKHQLVLVKMRCLYCLMKVIKLQYNIVEVHKL